MVWLNERSINIEMIKEGFAEAFIEYLICCKQKMEKVAKQKSIKLQLENP